MPKTEENIQMLINEYKNGDTLQQIAKRHGVSKSTIVAYLEERNIERHRPYRTIYDLDEHYFDDVDTPEKAYIIGLLAADGNVFKNSITLSLQEGDKHILEDVNRCLGSNRPLHYVKMPVGKNKWTLNIVNKYMAQSLKDLGIVENKSLILEFPECITDELLPHFLRGLLDGDGTIGSSRYTVGYTGTKMLLFTIAEKIERILDIHFYPRKEHCNNDVTYSIGIYKQDHCIRFLNYIYNNSTIHLNRKFALYQKYVDRSLLIA